MLSLNYHIEVDMHSKYCLFSVNEYVPFLYHVTLSIDSQVSRSFHFGSTGVHTTPFMFHMHEAWQAHNKDASVRITQQEIAG